MAIESLMAAPGEALPMGTPSINASQISARIWPKPAVIAPNNFKHKSLSCFSYNIAIGCEHACTFCYVPQVSTIRMTSALKPHGVTDPDKEWGDYVFLRQWDQAAFMASLLSSSDNSCADARCVSSAVRTTASCTEGSIQGGCAMPSA